MGEKYDWTEAKKAAGEAGYVIDTKSFEKAWEQTGSRPRNIIYDIKAIEWNAQIDIKVPTNSTFPQYDGFWKSEGNLSLIQLKALAVSHQALLASAREMLLQHDDEGHMERRDRCMKAIMEAGKL